MVDRIEAARELLRRRRAKDSIVDFSRYTLKGYIPADHHYLIAEKLEAVESGECKRLMIFMPPRHGKSELASRRFPAWFLGRNPDKNIIAASYNSDLAGDFGRDVRNIAKTQEYSNIFKTTLAEDSKAAGRWHTSGGGGYVAAGVGTAITGRGAHILIIDDPFKDRQSADSELIREKTYKWYLSTAYTRLEGGSADKDHDELWNDWMDADTNGKAFDGAIILIQTRWHEDDLAGRLLNDMEQGADQWDILKLPAINSEGKALWHKKYPLARLKTIKKALTKKYGSREWDSLYQQEPVAEEGSFFKREWFKRYKLGDEPATKNYQSTDFATREGAGDFTELGVFGVDREKHVWVKDWWYGQETTDVWIDEQLSQYEKNKCYAAFGETGQIRRAVEPFQTMRSRQRKIYPRLEWITRSGDKASIARSFQGMAAAGMVHVPHTDWGDRLINQLCTFPSGKYDDAVDVCALMGMVIQDAHPAIIGSKDKEAPTKDMWGRNKTGGSSWRT